MQMAACAGYADAVVRYQRIGSVAATEVRGCRVDVGLRDGEGCQRAAAVFDILAVDGHQHFDAGFVHQAADVCGQDDGRTAGGDGGNDALPFQFAQCFARAVGHGAAFFRPQGVVDVEEDDFGLGCGFHVFWFYSVAGRPSEKVGNGFQTAFSIWMPDCSRSRILQAQDVAARPPFVFRRPSDGYGRISISACGLTKA